MSAKRIKTVRQRNSARAASGYGFRVLIDRLKAKSRGAPGCKRTRPGLSFNREAFATCGPAKVSNLSRKRKNKPTKLQVGCVVIGLISKHSKVRCSGRVRGLSFVNQSFPASTKTTIGS